MRFTVMNDNGQFKLVCKNNLLFKNIKLFILRNKIVVILQSDFTDGNALRMRIKLSDFLKLII